jgi:hypothetical protein
MTKKLRAALAAFAPETVTSPTTQKGEGQELVGTLPAELISLFGFRKAKSDEWNEIRTRASSAFEEGGEIATMISSHEERHRAADFQESECYESITALQKRLRALKQEVEAAKVQAEEIDHLFWTLVRIEFNLFDAKRIVVGENWSVIKDTPTVDDIPLVEVEVIDASGIFGSGLFTESGFGSLASVMSGLFGGSFFSGGRRTHRRPSRHATPVAPDTEPGTPSKEEGDPAAAEASS